MVTQLFIHDVARIELTGGRQVATGHYVRNLLITQEGGSTFQIALFSEGTVPLVVDTTSVAQVA